jgi:protein ImuB
MNTVSKDRAAAPGARARQRILSLWLPYLPTDRLRREAGGPAWRGTRRPGDAPVAVAGKVDNALRLAAIDEAAAARGLRAGQALADARGAVPGLVVHEDDPDADAVLLQAIAEWCERYTPLVALDPPDGLFLDITGCAHLFAANEKDDGDGEAQLAADLSARLSVRGFAVRTAIATSPGAAWAFARYGEAAQRIAPGAERQALAGLPVAALRLDAGPLTLLDRLGLKRIGQLVGQPRAPLVARFGSALVTRLDQALGHEDEPLSPRLPAPALSAERRFAEPVADTCSIDATVRSLAAALQPALTRRGEGARALQLVLFASDGAVTRHGVGTAAPLRDAGLIAALFAERLAATETEQADFGAGYGDAAGFDMVRLCVTESEPLDEVQIDLAGEAGGAADRNQLFSRLGARLGEARVTRPIAVNTHIPEQAVQARPVALHPAVSGRAPPIADAFAGPFPGYPPGRPLKLFERPEPVEVVAEVPEGPPVAFRWRRVLYQVARAEGPERIAPEWWRDDMPAQNLVAATRDYFRLEDREGRRFWLYRDGLYEGEAGDGADCGAGGPCWYVHGLFA